MMKQEIKDRIQKIKSGVVPEGYKNSEIGILPNIWDAKYIGDIALIDTGNKDTKDKIDDGEYPFYVRSQNIERINTYSYDGEAVLTAGDGVGVGKVFHYVNGKFDYHQRVYKISDFKNYSGILFYQYFMKNFIKQVFKYNAKTSVDSVRMEMISKMLIPVPPLPEQQKIASILSTWDTAIELKEKLIEQKKKQKKGLMQNLLTGEVRLPGFDGEWKEVRLGEISKIRHGKDQKKIECQNGMYPILGTGGEIGRTNDYLCNKPSVLIGRKGTIDKPQYMDTPFWTVDTLFYTDIKDYINAKWLFYKYCMIPWKLYNEASGVPSLSASTIETIKVLVPPLDEQNYLSNILTTADKEISLLEQELEALILQKKGLMQLLLTGIVRVVI